LPLIVKDLLGQPSTSVDRNEDYRWYALSRYRVICDFHIEGY
jgi:hypothetical protein